MRYPGLHLIPRLGVRLAKHIFLSFVEEDLTSVNLFRGQAKNKNSALTFDDFSVKDPYNSTNAAYIRARITEKIRAASVTIVMIGTHTASSQWVDWEIEKSYELGNRVFGVRLGPYVATPPALVRHSAPVYDWRIDQIVSAIG